MCRLSIGSTECRTSSPTQTRGGKISKKADNLGGDNNGNLHPVVSMFTVLLIESLFHYNMQHEAQTGKET